MAENTTIKALEQGRAKFTYECVIQVLSLKAFKFNQHNIATNEILRKLFEDKFRKKIEINDEKDNDGKKKVKRDNKKILDEFLNNTLQKIEEYSLANGFKNEIIVFYEKINREYRSYVKNTPMLIKTNGLGATFAFMLSKGGTYKFIGEQVLEWLKNDEKGILPNAKDISSFEELNAEIISLESQKYRALTIEILAFFNWLRRFAEGLIRGEDENV